MSSFFKISKRQSIMISFLINHKKYGVIFLFFIGSIISWKVFGTIEKELDQNNVYYIFSTGAQTIAALVGFVLAAYTFNHQVMRSALENRDDISEIIETTIKTYYKYIMILSISTGVTLIADLLVLQSNMINNHKIKPGIFIFVGTLNVLIIIAAFLIALYIIRPLDIEKWARQILKNEGLTVSKNKPTVNTGDYIERFIKLERLLRDIVPNNYNLNAYKNSTIRNNLLFLVENGKIDKHTYNQFIKTIKYRNLIVHGHILQVDLDMFQILEELYREIEKIK